MRLPKKIMLGAILALLFIGCTKAPITGRNQLIMIDRGEEMKLGYQSAQQVLKKEKISNDRQKTAMVKKVGKRIKWEFYLIDNEKQANAFCLPGGKVFVYTGLFKYIANEDELAAVMGHEIGHAIARHGAERMSRGQLAQMSGSVLQAVMVGRGSPTSTAMVMQAFGIGTQLGVMLPHSREQENEADHIGVVRRKSSPNFLGEVCKKWKNSTRVPINTPSTCQSYT